MRRFILGVLILFFLADIAYAVRPPKEEVKEGNILYNKGEFEEALKEYEKAFLNSPDSDIVNFNIGTALYKTEDYKASVNHFEKVLVSKDKSLEEMASYNLGNAKYKYGIGQEETNIQNAIGLLKESLRHYEYALELDPKDEDAEYNYGFVKKELERLLEKQKKERQEKEKEKDKEKGQEKDESREEKDQSKEGKGQSQEQEKDREKEGKADREKESQKTGHSEQDEEEKKEQDEEERGGQDKQEDDKREQDEREQDSQGRRAEPGKREQEKPDKRPEAGAEEEPAEGMPEEEARSLLDNYGQEEEPKGLYKEKMPIQKIPPVIKDW